MTSPENAINSIASHLKAGYTGISLGGNYIKMWEWSWTLPEVKIPVDKSETYDWRKRDLLPTFGYMPVLLEVARFKSQVDAVTYDKLGTHAKRIAAFMGLVPKEELLRLTDPSMLLRLVGIVERYLKDGYEVASVGPNEITFLKVGDKVHLDIEPRDVLPYVTVNLLPESYYFNDIVDIAMVKLGTKILAEASDFAKRSAEFLKIIPPPPPVIPIIPPEEVVPPKIPILPILLIGGGLAAGAYLLLRKKR